MRFIQTVLRGIGQVMFQNNIYSGTLFLGGIFYNSWLLGLAALLGTIVSTISAQILRYPKEDIQNGLYGFNGALTGIAVLCFFEVNLITILAMVAGASLSTLAMNWLKRIIPPFTAPFVMVTWVVIYSLLFIFKLPLLSSSEPTGNVINILAASSNSFGQVMLQENIITGLFFLLAILVNNRLMAIYAVYAAVLGSLAGWLFSEPFPTVNAGLMGYNAILCAIALTGKSWRDFLWITTAIILSTLLNIGLGMTGLITLTAPFVLVTWVIWNLKQFFLAEKRLA
ncbi:MAG TPA: urea transporter [Bacteroidales bacterium]|jgi:urea transporter|nr:urea transporter [Bacteroidales bacterium]